MGQREWSTVELGILLRYAGHSPIEWIAEKLDRPREEVEDVAARVRATGYPIWLTLEVCPQCGQPARLSCLRKRRTD